MRLIDADALQKEFIYTCTGQCNTCPYIKYKENTVGWEGCGLIDNAPTVEITDYDTGYQDGLEDGLNDIRTHGEWIEGKNGNIKCNQCGCEIRYSYFIGNKPEFPKFCSECGADM